MARPLFLKYVLDKKRNFIEEVITEEFLKSLVGKFKQCCESSIKLREEKIDNLNGDKNNSSEQTLQKLQLSHEQYSAQVQAEINQVNRLIETVKSYLLQFQTYDNCSDIIGAREEILSYTKQCNHNILCNMLSPRLEEGFKGYLEQLGVQLDAQEVKSMYNRIEKNCNYKEAYASCACGFLISCACSLLLPPLTALVLYLTQITARLLFFTRNLMSLSTFENLVYGSFAVPVALLSIGLLLLPVITYYNHMQKSLLNLNCENVSYSERIVKTPTAHPASEMKSVEELKKLNIDCNERESLATN